MMDPRYPPRIVRYLNEKSEFGGFFFLGKYSLVSLHVHKPVFLDGGMEFPVHKYDDQWAPVRDHHTLSLPPQFPRSCLRRHPT